MRLYQGQHRFYAGVDLHARSLYLCLTDPNGQILLHKNLPARPEAFLQAVEPYRDGLVVACECVFAWYWLADTCRRHGIPFVLGHALEMRAIHGTKTKDDKIDAEKIAHLLRAGLLPQAYVYPKGMRETRDLLRRRTSLVRKRAEALVHLTNTNSQYNLPPFGKKLIYAKNRQALKIAERFADPSVRASVQADLAVIDRYDEVIAELELYLERTVKVEDGDTYLRLRSVPGVGKILALVLLYEIHDIRRFADVGRFLSYARLIRPDHESAGKKCGFGQKKIGNAHLRWALGEAVALLLRESDQAKKWLARRQKKSGKGKALGILAAKLGRAIYWMLRRKEAFNPKRFWQS
jgi:transposase